MKSPRFPTRRRFLGEIAGGALAAVVVPTLLQPRPARAATAGSPARQIVVGLIGCGDCGSRQHLPTLRAHPRVAVAAVCDVDAQRLETARQRAEEAGSRRVSAYADYRRLLERDDIDAVVIATPDHWHALMAIDAMEAGKDVYCESPLSLSVEEGRRIVRTAQIYATVFQCGYALRSDRGLYRALLDAAQAGAIGQVTKIATHLDPPAPGVWHPGEPPPAHLDWDRWLGPAPYAEYAPNRCHGHFRRYADYAGGVIADQGGHFFDLAQRILGADGSGPTQVEARGRFHPDGPYEDPVSFEGRAVYGPQGDVEVTVSSAPGPRLKITGRAGWLAVSTRGLEASQPALLRELSRVAPMEEAARAGAHLENWLDCIATRKRPVSDVESAHRSTTVVHLINHAIRLQRPLAWNPAREAFPVGDPAEGLLRRPERPGWRI